MKLLNKRNITFIIIVITVVFNWLIPLPDAAVTFDIRYDTNIQSFAQMFYDTGLAYSEDDSIVAEISDAKAEVSLDADQFKKIISIRLDPVREKQDEFKIEDISVCYRGKEVLDLSSKQIRAYVAAFQNMSLADNDMNITDVDNDPIIIFSSEFVSDIDKNINSERLKIDLLKKALRYIIIVAMVSVGVLFTYMFLCNGLMCQKLKIFIVKNKLYKVGTGRKVILAISEILILSITTKKSWVNNNSL